MGNKESFFCVTATPFIYVSEMKKEGKPMVHLEKVTSQNIEEIIDMDIFESQYPFVADNVESLAEAYVAITSDGAWAYPFVICNDDTPVGFLMLGYNEAALEGPEAPASLRNNYSLWRVMIDNLIMISDALK